MLKFFFDVKTKRRFAVTVKTLPKQNVKKVYAAIAFTQDDLLVKTCIENKIQLEWWGLFDSGNSTNYDIVKQAITSDIVKFYPFASLFHPKVIYFEGYGIYIGSANMTKNAMYNNVEAGVFIDQEDLTAQDLEEIAAFFSYLRNQSVQATYDDIEQIEKFLESSTLDREDVDKINSNIDENFKECLGHLFLLKPGVTDYGSDKEKTESKRKLIFMQEWRETQNFLHNVKDVMIDKCTQPVWIDKNAHPTIITDQLLHAYYYSFVLRGKGEHKSIERVREFYNLNKSNPGKGILNAIEWWENLGEAPSDEDVHINLWGVENEKILRKLKTEDLNYDEFLKVMRQNHAARNHARQIKNKFFNLPDDFHTDIEGRIEIFSEWLFKQKSKTGKSINEVMKYILFSEEPMLEERIYNALNTDEYHIERFGKSIIGELVGWGRPDITHLRNNRVNKGLRCLGYDVRLFSE